MTSEHKIDQKRLAKLEGITLLCGKHERQEQGGCVMEWVSYLAGEEWSDHPKCVCPVIAAAARTLNDRMPADLRNELLRPLMARFVGSRSTRKVEKARMYLAADFAVRVFAPLALEARGHKDHAEKLRACAPIVDKSMAEEGRRLARAAAADADAAAAYAPAAAAADAAADAAARDKQLSIFAEGVVQILIDMKAPGAKWLSLLA